MIETKTGLPDRRTVLAAAWSVPVIATVSATPAFAASMATITLSMAVWQVSEWDANLEGHVFKGLAGNLHVQEVWDSAGIIVKSGTLTMTLEKQGMAKKAPTVSSGAGWVASTGSTSGKDAIYTFSWSGSMNTTGPGATSMEFWLPGSEELRKDHWFPMTVNASFKGSNAVVATTSAVAPLQ